MRPITTDMTQLESRPYFFWDEDVSIAELKEKLKSADTYERDRLFGKMLREARDLDVWHFTSPKEVAESLSRLQRIVGKRHAFWRYLIDGWRQDGLL